MNRRQSIQLLTGLGLLAGFTFRSLARVRAIPVKTLTGQEKPQLHGIGFQLIPEAAKKFTEMKIAAAQDGFNIYCVSSYRSFEDQKRIWESKFYRFTKAGATPIDAIQKIIEYSTIPGTSRHHWATDVDIVDGNKRVTGDVLLPELFEDGQPYGPFKNWLSKNATNFGFHEVYDNRRERKGFKYEPWHFSYAPVSRQYLTEYSTLDFPELLRSLDISGSKLFSDDFIDAYWREQMLDINRELLPLK